MKNVILIGDSIMFGSKNDLSPGYGVYVKELLSGKADVCFPNENCRFALYTLRYFHEWLSLSGMEKVDVVHWNNGLWDVARMYGDEPLVPVEFYVDTMKRVYSRIRLLCPDAKIIFATSTPVIEERANPNFKRRNADIERYNAAVVKELEAMGVEINDLHSVAASFDPSLHVDWVHYGNEGSRLLAERVAERIERHLCE